MRPFRYRLVVTTDGRPGLLEATLDSFLSRVKPEPAEVWLVDDSGDADRKRSLDALCRDYAAHGLTFGYTWHPARLGFCATVRDAWTVATAGDGDPAYEPPPWVFWVEDDFDFTRQVDLRELGNVLAHEPKIAQMGLMRQPVNERERQAGGLFNLNRDRYTQMGHGGVAWLRSRTNFSTTCSLMRRSFMAEYPWPDYERECEGRYSIDLLAAGYEFAVWGIGSPWIRHTGDVRAGKGY